MDFVILDVDNDVEVSLILGCPFLNTSGALIDVNEGKMTLRVGEEQVVLTLLEVMKHTLNHDDTLYFTDETDLIISNCVQEMLALNPLDDYLEELDSKGDKEQVSTPPVVLQANYVRTNPSPSGKKRKGLKKMWCKANKKIKKSVNIMLLPP